MNLPRPLESLRKWIGIEKYACLPLLLCLVTNCSVYYISRLLSQGRPFHDVSIALDSMIPCIPFFFSWWYYAAFVFWAIAYVNYANLGKSHAWEIFFADFVGKIICAFFYIFYPTNLVWPEVVIRDYWSFMLGVIHNLDRPTNLFPSIHVLVSWLAFRYVYRIPTVSKRYKDLTLMGSLLVILSILFAKQHLVVDIFGGIVVAELGILVSSLVHGKGSTLETEKINKKLRKSEILFT